jgi:hypothetical protein
MMARFQDMTKANALQGGANEPNDGIPIVRKQDDGNLQTKMATIRAMQRQHRSNWKPRFQVGASVECRCQGGWYRATVVQQRYREPDWKTGRVAAYQCELNDGDGTLIFVPMDHDSLVRKAP